MPPLLEARGPLVIARHAASSNSVLTADRYREEFAMKTDRIPLAWPLSVAYLKLESLAFLSCSFASCKAGCFTEGCSDSKTLVHVWTFLDFDAADI